MIDEMNQEFEEFLNYGGIDQAEQRETALRSFIIQAHKNNSDIASELLAEQMESAGFHDEMNNKYVSIYIEGRKLLAQYDQ